MRYRVNLTPRDVLFFKDARPMEASDAGHGGNWPRPDQFYSAIRHALLSRWPDMQEWEGELHTKREKENDSSFRFGALKTFGPFPCDGDELYLPMPLDWNMDVVSLSQTDLPSPLTHGFRSRSQEKRKDPPWISRTNYEAYLNGEFPELSSDTDEKDDDRKKEKVLYSIDRNIGIGIDPERAATKKGALYQAEYLRLRDGVALSGEAECVIKPKRREGPVDVFARDDFPKDCIFGGQQGVCSLKRESGRLALPKAPEISTPYLRWTLLSPALFNAGWKPGWLSDDGKVKLPRTREALERLPGEDRKAWRERMFASIGFDARLIAARIGKPLAFSGWDERAGGPKPTALAVPSGSSYVFRCASVEEAKALAAVLNAPNRHSDANGEKGFGVGLCSSIQVND